MELKNTFNNIIADYDYARPHYPAQLFTDIATFAGQGPTAAWRGANVLEIGAGTGQATEHLIGLDAQLTLLELGEAQAAYLTGKFPTARVFCTPFEEFQAPENSFDLIVSATAFHWIDAAIGYPKAHALLKKNGVMAVFWHNSSVTHFTDAMHCGIRTLCRRYSPTLYEGLTMEGLAAVHEKRLRQISCGFPDAPDFHEYRWTDIYTAKRYTALLNSYSDFQILEPSIRENLLNEIDAYIATHGGEVEVPQCVRLYLMKKQP